MPSKYILPSLPSKTPVRYVHFFALRASVVVKSAMLTAGDRKWLVDQFFDTKELVQSSDEPLTIYESNKPFEKGEVTLEHVNAGNGMYVVVVEGTGKGLAVKPEGKLATRWSALKRK